MKIDGRPNFNLQIVLTLNESEARALDALAGYGVDSFLKVFYANMGKAYLLPHEAGLRSLFEGIRDTSGLSSILDRAEKAQAVFDGTREAVYPRRVSCEDVPPPPSAVPVAVPASEDEDNAPF